MKSFILKSIVLIFAVSIQTSCVDDDGNDCYYEIVSLATEVTGPTTSAVNVPIVFNVKFLPFDGCTTFLRFNQERVNNVFYLDVISKGEQCGCDQEIVEGTATYSFTPSTPGVYTFRFTSDVDAAIIKNVTVE
jgi:hypothetical protein